MSNSKRNIKSCIKIVLVLLVILLSTIILKINKTYAVDPVAFYRENFDNSFLEISGDAYCSGGNIYLTAADQWKAGGVFNKSKIRETNGFSTYFCLSTDGHSGEQADGFTIILARDANHINYDSLKGCNLGYGNIGASIGIEIDFYQNPSYDGYEPSIPHMYLWSRTEDVEEESGIHGEDGTYHLDSAILNGDFYVWVCYDNITHVISVYVSKTTTRPDTPAGTFYINLGSIIGSEYYVGISASTGNEYQAHIVKKWGYSNVNDYDPNEKKLTVNPNGGTWNGSTNAQTFSLGSGATKWIPVPTRSGYKFTGWTLTGTGSTMTSLTGSSTFRMGTANATLTANWEAYRAKITLNKTDSVTGESLKGAVFGLYEWNGSSYGRIAVLTDNNNGTYSTPVIQYTDRNKGKFKIVEESAPTYYTNSGWSREILLSESGYHEYSYSLTNVPYPRAVITLNKTDSITGEKLDGATFELYEWNGSTYIKKGTITDNRNGTYTTSLMQYTDINKGKFKIIEKAAPTYYTNSGWSREITLTEPGYHTYSYNITNEPNKVKVQAIKVDSETRNRIQGATFTIYEWNKNTGRYEEYARDVALDFQADRSYLSDWLYSNRKNEGKFRIIETGTPEGYYGDYRNGNKVNNDITITQNLDGQTITIKNQDTLYINARVKGTINVNKIDRETTNSTAQGDATLDGAIYGLYAAEDIYHKDTVNGKIYNRNQLVETQTVVNGVLKYENVEIGKYYIKEIQPSRGYILSNDRYEVNMNYEGDTVPHLTRNVTVSGQVIKQAFRLQKVSINEDSTEVNPLENAGFKIFLIKDLEGVKNGSIKANSRGTYEIRDFIGYDFSREETAIDYSRNSNGERITELFTNADGQITSPELAYGKYVVIESTVPKDFAAIKPFIVTIEEDSRTPQKQRYFIDKEFEALIKVIKKDTLTGKTVLNNKAKYRIWSVEENKYVEQIVSYPEVKVYGTEENPYEINAKGEFITPLKLKMGTYELREIEAPKGYILTGYEGKIKNGVYEERPASSVRFTITTDAVYYEEENAKEIVINVSQYNDEMLGELEITKTGERLVGITTREDGTIDTLYEEDIVEGAEYEIYAKEDIYTQDNQGTKLCEKDELVKKITTNAEGKAYLDNLPIGKYYIKEVKAGEGLVINKEIKEFEIKYQDEKTPIQKVEIKYKNERQKIELSREEGIEIQKIADKAVYKTGEKITYTIRVTNTTGNKIENVKVTEMIMEGKFEDISTDNIVKTGDKTVEIKELKPKESIELKFIAEVKKYENITKATKRQIEEEKIKIVNQVKAEGSIKETNPEDPSQEIEKEIEGQGEEEIYISNKNLVVIKEAVKKEYQVGEKVQYAVKVINNGKEKITNVLVEEQMKEGTFVEIEELNKNGIKVTQKGNNQVEISEIESGEMITLKYEYLITNSTKVVVDSGKKIILENKVTVTGNIEDKENPEETKEVQDESTEEVEIDLTGTKENKIGIRKKDLETGETVEGAEIGLYALENITNQKGKILIAKDSLIEKVTTDKLGRANYTVDLPHGKYYIKEIKAPAGYIISDEKIEIDASYKNQEIEKLIIDKILTNRSTNIKIGKKDSKEKLLEGAKLEIINEQGKVVDTWETKEDLHTFRRVEIGKIYTLKEVKPAKGYVTEPDIKFQIDGEGKAYYVGEKKEDGLTVKQYKETPIIEMIDQKTKVKIEVIDKETQEPISGIKIQIIDKETQEIIYEVETTEEEKIIEGLPIGEYEIKTTDPENRGYVTTTKEVEIKDTKEEQEIKIEEEQTKIKIIIKDEETGEKIKEGKFEIIDKDGKVIETIETKDGIAEIEGLPQGEYTIHQIEAPKKYNKAEDKKIEVKGIEEIEILNKKTLYNFAIEKTLRSITLNGKNLEISDNKLSKIEIKTSEIKKTELIARYNIKVINKGEAEGKVTVIEMIPEGYVIEETGENWKVRPDGTLETEVELKVGESRDIEIALKWINKENNLGAKPNKAKIDQAENESNLTDINAEDDLSEATIIISIKTGQVVSVIIIIMIIIALIICGYIITISIKGMNRGPSIRRIKFLNRR